MKNYRYILKNLDCANCAKKIEDKISENKEFENVCVNFSTLNLSFISKRENITKEEIEYAVKSVEPEVEIVEQKENNKENNSGNSEIIKEIVRLFCGILVFILITLILKENLLLYKIGVILAYVILAIKTCKKAFKQIVKNKVLDENALIVISSIGALAIGKESEGLMVIVLYEIGKILESKAINKTRKSISDLMNIKPEYANLKDNNEIKKVLPEELKIGDVIIIKAGEKVPVDGVIISGKAEIDNQALTGESKIITRSIEEDVLSGSVNVEGIIEVKVTKEYKDSTVTKILELVENATDKKSKAENFVSKIAKIYTPVVIMLAILVFVVAPLVTNLTYIDSLYKALTFLVISCPCAIVISVPLTYFYGIGRASKKGVLIKGSDYLDLLKDIDEIVFDKTGTITTGKFSVTSVNVLNNKYTEKEVLEYYGLGESFSNHPISKSILQKIDFEINTSKVNNFKEISGEGIYYETEGKKVKIGKASFVGVEKDKTRGTVIYLSIDNEIIAKIILNDTLKSNVKTVISNLENNGITTKMYTGDKKELAEFVAEEAGIKFVKAEMLPTEKYSELEKEIELRKQNNLGKVAFVGDGINDSPVLARADVGMSMGAIGSSSAIEASDVVIMNDDLNSIIEAINISKRTNRKIKQNLIFAISVKILVLILSLLGINNMWQAVFADVGVTLITILWSTF